VKWVFIAGGVALFIFVLTLIALYQRDVVWNGSQPHCPHCRALVAPYASVCATCRNRFDWVADERPCPVGLSETEVSFLHSISEADARAKVAAAGGTVAGLDADAVVGWLRKIDANECVFCAGTGDALGLEAGSPLAKLSNELDDDCPVCVGEDDCVGCDGDGESEYGDEDAHRLLEEYVERREGGRPLIGALPSAEVAGSFRRTMSKLAGSSEVDQLWFPHGTENVVEVAENRRDALLELFRPAD